MLGSFTAWAVGEGRRPGQRTLLQSRHRADDALANRLGIAPGDPTMTIVRVRTLDGTPVLLERTSFVWDVGQVLMEFDPDSGSLNRYLLDRGVDLYSSNHLLDAVTADSEDVEALAVEEGSPLLRVRCTMLDSTGRIIEWAEDRYLPDHCAISITNQLIAADGRRDRIRLV